MSRPPEPPRAPHRRSFAVFVLVLAAAALGAMAISRGEGAVATLATPPLRMETLVTTPFVGASAARTFLSRQESAEAARRDLVPPGTRSVLATSGPLKFGSWRWDEAGVPPGPLSIRVDLARQLLSVFRGPDEIGTAVVVYGIEGKETPRGKLPILGKTRDYHSKTYDAPMPFSLWLRDDGVAIHGSTVTAGHATNGCIGVPVGFAEKLFAVAGKGDMVEVVEGVSVA